MGEKFHLSIFAHFESDEARRAWMMDHVIKQCRPHNGPIFSWSSDDESGYRDLVEEMAEHLGELLAQGNAGKRARELISKARGIEPIPNKLPPIHNGEQP